MGYIPSVYQSGERSHAHPWHGTNRAVASAGSVVPASGSPCVLAVPARQHESRREPRVCAESITRWC